MVGEIRDRETVEVAVEAALTGHLVLSTIHTNSAVTTITRLLDMGTPGFLITATVNAIIAQRLVRRICEKCKKEDELTESVEKKMRKAITTMNPEQRAKLKLESDDAPLKIWYGEGCEACGDTGYSGRIGLYEILEMSNDLKDLILQNATPHAIEKEAIKEGMKTLEHDGIERILAGVTTPAEVYAVARSTDKSESKVKHQSEGEPKDDIVSGKDEDAASKRR